MAWSADDRGDVYTVPIDEDPEDRFTADEPVAKTKPVRKTKAKAKPKAKPDLDLTERTLFDDMDKPARLAESFTGGEPVYRGEGGFLRFFCGSLLTFEQIRDLEDEDLSNSELALRFPKIPEVVPVDKPDITLSPVVKGAKHDTREQWLLAACAAVRPLFDAQGIDAYPPLRVSCGWPKGGRKAIGQCWPSGRSGDKTIEMFISPELIDGVQVLHILIHELIHAVDNCENKHRGPFRKMALALGLEGKMTATTAGPELEAELRLLLGNLGPYPHAKLDPTKITKQGTRMLKVVCKDKACGYTLRTTKKWIEVGLPSCFCGAGEMEAE